MLATNIPYLHCRNGIYYYRNQSTWKSLRTRCKQEAFKKLCITMFGVTPALTNTTTSLNDTSCTVNDAKLAVNDDLPTTPNLIKAYLAENGNRWCAR